MPDKKDRIDIIRLMRDKEVTDESSNPMDTPLFHELGKMYIKWMKRFEKESMEMVQKPRYPWTPELRQKFLRTPVRDLILDDYYLGLDGEIFPSHLEEIELAFNYWRQGLITEAIDISAIGTGKSFKSGVLAWLLTADTLTHEYPALEFGLAKRSKIAMTITSRNAKLAKEVTFLQMLPFFDCGFFRDYFPPQINLSLVEEQRHYPAALKFPKRFAIFPGIGSAMSVLGYNLIFAILDEFSWMEKVAKSTKSQYGFNSTEYDAALETYNAIDTRIFSRTLSGKKNGFIFMIGSPRTKWDYAEIKYQQGVKNAEKLKRGEPLTTVSDLITPSQDGKRIYQMPSDIKHIPKPIFSMSRKSVWRARPRVWKGKVQWSGDYLVFDITKMHFVNNEVHHGLFDTDSDWITETLLKVPIELAPRFQENPYRAFRDLAAQPTAGIFRFFTNLETIKFTREYKNGVRVSGNSPKFKDFYHANNSPDRERRRYIHIDLGQNRDCAAAACCYCVGFADNRDKTKRMPVAKFEWLGEWYPESGNTDIRVADVMSLPITMMRELGFDVGLVTYDRFQSLQSIQTLWDQHGIPTGQLSIDYTTNRVLIAPVGSNSDYGTTREPVRSQPCAAFEELREAHLEDRILLPVYENPRCSLMSQYEQEEYYPALHSGKGKVDHPPGGKHDLLQAITGAYWNMLNNEWWSPLYTQYMQDPNTIQLIQQEARLESAVHHAGFLPEDLEKMGF